ncbi:MAG: short-chain dehydrogenase [Pseudobdellovibrio sp.]|jgi:NAD(P)-dependent dehydrogenase (short-subunit alcohol dehydrogenase family)|nr:short-chain dehydrogenase [Pseudobdellovibrio sp.]
MKNVLITGAGRGIGFSLVKEFANNGYTVLATYRDAAAAKNLLAFSKDNPKVKTVTADVSDESSFADLKAAVQRLGHIHILINNAGVIGGKARNLQELNLDEMNKVFQVNTFGPIKVCKAVMPFVPKDGKVVQISSLMGSISDNGSGGYYDYRMSKTALNMFNMCLSMEFPDVTCLTLHPGWVQTDMGGAGATLPVDQCAKGLYKVITEATAAQSGDFLDYRGHQLGW